MKWLKGIIGSSLFGQNAQNQFPASQTQQQALAQQQQLTNHQTSIGGQSLANTTGSVLVTNGSGTTHTVNWGNSSGNPVYIPVNSQWSTFSFEPWEEKNETKNTYTKDVIELVVEVRKKFSSTYTALPINYQENEAAELILKYVKEQTFKAKLQTIVDE